MSSGVGDYDEFAQERFVAEPAKSSKRSSFERDRARVLHSSALRRLAGKTQVVVPWESDFPRTRLTHSLECAQIGRELGKAVGSDPDLVEVACLAHDLGHPPFGHNGEQALDELATDSGGFEGNAQSLRILIRLEAKVVTDEGRSAGLNLTRAALDAATKYPWGREGEASKFGVYQDDEEIFQWMRSDEHGQQRCIEAQVMDWADDVAYSVHDFEDAVYAGHLVLSSLRESSERVELIALTADRYAVGVRPELLDQALERLLSLEVWPDNFDESHQALAHLKGTTSFLIGRFCSAAGAATRSRYGDSPLTRYQADLIVPDNVRHECAVLKAIAARYVMLREGAPEGYARQRTLVAELTEAMYEQAPATLDPVYAGWFKEAADDPARLRVVIDQVASLTDRAAVSLHTRLTNRPAR